MTQTPKPTWRANHHTTCWEVSYDVIQTWDGKYRLDVNGVPKCAGTLAQCKRKAVELMGVQYKQRYAK